MTAPLTPLNGNSDFFGILEALAMAASNRRAVTLGVDAPLSFFEVHERAKKASCFITEKTQPGDRVALCLSTSSAFLDLFLGCIYSGRIVVPLPIEKTNDRAYRSTAAINDCVPRLIIMQNHENAPVDVLRSGATIIDVQEWLGSITKYDDLPAVKEVDIKIDPHAIAMIQYTSGSTSAPKGVLLTQHNLVSNIRMIQASMMITPADKIFSWLPLYHDMGLIGMLLTPLLTGASAAIVPHPVFTADPLSWLQSCSNLSITLTGAPTFAFSSTSKALSRRRSIDLDLSKIRLLYCGSEKIVPNAIAEFYEKLRPYGLNESSFFPCYGLAEASLFVSGGFRKPSLLADDRASNSYCGALARDISVEILDQNGDPLPPGSMGELTLKGPSISQGYWNGSEPGQNRKSSTDFEVRTGDLGYLKDGELFITGRKKDVIKINGRGIHPEDLEATIESTIPWLSANSTVVCADPNEKHESILVIVELPRTKRSFDPYEILSSVQAALSVHDVKCDRLVTVLPFALPKTTSGKKQRRLTVEALSSGKILPIWDSRKVLEGQLDSLRHEQGLNYAMTILENLKRDFKSSEFIWSDERRSFNSDVLLRLFRSGALKYGVPSDSNNHPFSTAGYIALGKGLAQINMSLAGIVGIHSTLGVHPIRESGTLPDKASVLADVSQSGALCAFAITESSSGSNPRSISTLVAARGSQLILNGEKIWIGNGNLAKYFTVIAKEISERGDDLGYSAFLLKKGTHKFEVQGEMLTLGLRSMPQNRLLFQDTILAESDRLSEPGRGLELAYRTMELARVGLLGVAIGAMETALIKTLTFATSREIWGGVLSENKHFQNRISEIQLRLKALILFAEKIGQSFPIPGTVPTPISTVAKMTSSEWAFEAIDTCLQFCGGRGYTETFGLAPLFRDVRILRIFEGPTEALAAQIGSSSINGGADWLAQNLMISPKRAARIVSTWSQGAHLDTASLGKLIGELSVLDHLIDAETKESNYAEALFDYELKKFTWSENVHARFKNENFNEMRTETSTDEVGLYDNWSGNVFIRAPSKTIVNQGTAPSVDTGVVLNKKHEINILNEVKSDSDGQQPARAVLDRANIRLILVDWLRKNTRRAQIDESISLNKLGIDSLLGYEMLCFVEEEFGVRLPETILSQRPTLADVVTIVLNSQSKGTSENVQEEKLL